MKRWWKKKDTERFSLKRVLHPTHSQIAICIDNSQSLLDRLGFLRDSFATARALALRARSGRLTRRYRCRGARGLGTRIFEVTLTCDRVKSLIRYPCVGGILTFVIHVIQTDIAPLPFHSTRCFFALLTFRFIPPVSRPLRAPSVR